MCLVVQTYLNTGLSKLGALAISYRTEDSAAAEGKKEGESGSVQGRAGEGEEEDKHHGRKVSASVGILGGLEHQVSQ